MEFGPASYGLAFVAGNLSTLSPCVLPLVPILLGTAVGSHRYGPYALAGGLALSFTAVGVLVASLVSAVLAAVVLAGRNKAYRRIAAAQAADADRD